MQNKQPNRLFFNIILMLFTLFPTIEAQNLHRKNAFMLSYGLENRGFALSYERRMFRLTNTLTIGTKGFLGYGFQQTPSNSVKWNFSTYYPHFIDEKGGSYYHFGNHSEFSFGLEANILWGKRKHFIESAFGASLDIFDRPLNYYAHHKQLGNHPSHKAMEAVQASKFANHYYLKTGYRFVANAGVTLGVGITWHKLAGLFTYFYAREKSITPYFSIGYSF